MRLLLMGPPGRTDQPTLAGRDDTQRGFGPDRPVEQSRVSAFWPDGSRSQAEAGFARGIAPGGIAWGPVLHLIDVMVPGQPWDGGLQFTFGPRQVEHGSLDVAHFHRLGFSVFTLADDPFRPTFTSILVMAGPHDVTEEPTWYWAEEDSQPSAATCFPHHDS